MTAADTFLPLPTVSFRDQAEFREWRRHNGGLVAARAQRDPAPAAGRIDGSCGVCLRPASFHPGHGAMACDCETGLPARHRALLQFVLGNVGVQPWYKVLVLAPGLRGCLAALARVSHAPAPGHHLAVTDAAPDSPAHIADALVPGGQVVFTCDFVPEQPESWNLLVALRAAGFHSVAAHLYWSEEFGYPGPANFVCNGVR